MNTTSVIHQVWKNLPHHDRRIYISNRSNGEWTEPQLASFSSDFADRGSSFSPDGNTLFFGSNRPGKRGFDYDSDIWFSSKKFDGTRGEATRMGEAINSDLYNEGHPFIAKMGTFTLYDTGEGKKRIST